MMMCLVMIMIMIMIMKKMMVVEKIIHANWDSAKFHGAADASALPSHLQSENFPLLYRVFFFHCVIIPSTDFATN